MIVVVEHGRISQTGTHAQLMAEGGKYRTMVEQQIRMTLGAMPPRSLGGSEFTAFVTRVDRGDSVA